MPRSESDVLIENVLAKTKDRKSGKKCKESKCDVECCVSDCNPECCTQAYQRLDKLRNLWLLTQYNMSNPVISFDVSGNYGPTNSNIFNRAGQLITDASPINGLQDWGNLSLAAYAFVNEVRYLNFEECGKLNQVTGWSVDIATGDLHIYQNLSSLGLTTLDSRAALLNIPPSNLTPNDRRKLAEMEPFWKLSLKSIERVRENPMTEGNICEIKDKCGNKFLVAINRANGQSSDNGVCEYNSKYTIVVVKLC